MAVRKIRDTWWVDFRSEYIRYRKRSPENTRAGAKAYENLLRERLARGVPLDGKHPEQYFQQFAELWFDGYARTNNKPSEQRQKQLTLRSSLIPFFGHKSLGSITKRDIELYKASEQRKGLSNKTINNKLGILRKCLSTAYDWDVLNALPPAIKPLKCPPPVTSYLSASEAEALLAHSTGITHEMILLALRTGLRQGEIRGLQWEAIDWENRVLVVRHSYCDYTHSLTSPKSNRERAIPLADDVYERLHVRRRSTGFVFTEQHGGPFPQTSHRRLLRNAQQSAGLNGIGWHTLRHTFATQLASKGVPLRTVQELLGHSTITMTMRYSHVAAESLRSAIDVLSVRTARPAHFGQPVGNLINPI